MFRLLFFSLSWMESRRANRKYIYNKQAKNQNRRCAIRHQREKGLKPTKHTIFENTPEKKQQQEAAHMQLKFCNSITRDLRFTGPLLAHTHSWRCGVTHTHTHAEKGDLVCVYCFNWRPFARASIRTFLSVIVVVVIFRMGARKIRMHAYTHFGCCYFAWR